MNKGKLAGLWMGLFYAVVLFTPASVTAQMGYSGASWGEMRHEGGEGSSNTLLYGWIDQGVDWWELYGMKVSTYGVLRYSLDTEALEWNNFLAPGVGLAVRKGAMKIGAEVYQQRFLKSDTTENKAILYINWWKGWDLRR